jgi:hypothetical protein
LMQTPAVSLTALACASPQELLTEENSARVSRGMPPLCRQTGVSDDWTYLLSPARRRLLDKLLIAWRQKHGQDARQDCQCVLVLSRSERRSSSLPLRGVVPTITSAMKRLIWLPARGRWFLQRELAAAMGYPVYPWLAQAASVPQDHVTAELGRAGGFPMLGRAMHVASVGMVMVVRVVPLLLSIPRGFSKTSPLPLDPSLAGPKLSCCCSCVAV